VKMSLMDPHSILDKANSQEAPAADSVPQRWPGTGAETPPVPGDMRFPGEDGGKSLAEMAQKDLTATLQLLAERTQYITGATGAAIALRDREQMVCRASAGTSAPEVGAQLQVNSGLSGESIRTRQTLRCDDAGTDPRVNRESCEALGIASVVVMPLLQGNEVVGVFELFSDKTNIFEARDITALERMGSMVFIALEHAIAGLTPEAKDAFATPARPSVEPAPEQGLAEGPVLAPIPNAVPAGLGESVPAAETATPFDRKATKAGAVASTPEVPRMAPGIVFHRRGPAAVPPFVAPKATPKIAPATDVQANAAAPVEDEDILGDTAATPTAPSLDRAASLQKAPPGSTAAETTSVPELLDQPETEIVRDATGAESPVGSEHGLHAPVVVGRAPVAPPTRSAVANLRKCEACGFPVSEGRKLCLDCEKKKRRSGEPVAGNTVPLALAGPADRALPATSPSAPIVSPGDEGLRFLGQQVQESSWLASHKYLVGALVIAVVGVVVLLLVR
jgi:putative methionine-R-sulfoxide reductase with GAF domain